MSNFVESVFKMSKIEFIDTCDRFPELKNRELILDIYNHIYSRIGLEHLHPGINEKSGHGYHQAIETI